MPRIRSIKPEAFLHEGLYDLEIETGLPIRWAFAGLWCHADREGRFEWRPRRLKAGILPHDHVDFSRVLHALATRGFICNYASNGVEYGHIPGFHRHQVINNREAESELPPPPATPAESDGSTRAPRVTHACPTDVRNPLQEGKGREGSISIPPKPPLPAKHLTVEDVFGADPEPSTDPTVAAVADVSTRWERAFAKCRNGATYRPNPHRDYAAFRELVDAYPDHDHLERMFEFFFSADDLPEWAASRSPKCFVRLAPETDAAVRAVRR